MRRILLACAAGMSTSMLALRMRQAAEEEGYECEIHAYPFQNLEDEIDGFDIVLLGPQARFQLDMVAEMTTQPVLIIDLRDYGTMNGKAVLKRVQEVLGD